MYQYRIFAEFDGDIYSDRQYKRKFYKSFEEAEAEFLIALDYYKSQTYKNALKRLTIQRCEIPTWEVCKEAR